METELPTKPPRIFKKVDDKEKKKKLPTKPPCIFKKVDDKVKKKKCQLPSAVR